jgi:hypothetical protein
MTSACGIQLHLANFYEQPSESDYIYQRFSESSTSVTADDLLLLQDDARPYTALTTANLLNTWHWEIRPHPIYSPDLAPSHFQLPPKLKKHVSFYLCGNKSLHLSVF